LFTVINTDVVEPGRVERLIETLVRATNDELRHVPGFANASFHVSLDSTGLVTYASGAAAKSSRLREMTPE